MPCQQLTREEQSMSAPMCSLSVPIRHITVQLGEERGFEEVFARAQVLHVNREFTWPNVLRT